MTTHRENVIAVIHGGKPDVIPCLGECPMDVAVLRDIMPPPTGDPIRDAIRQAEFFDNSALRVGLGIRAETISRDENHHTYRYETGAVWHESYRLKAMADLCHEHGAYFHLHSRGHIEDVMDGIVEAGVTIINPIGPSDHNDLAMFKQRWGDKITLHGGISTTIASMTEEELRDHVHNVVEVGRVGGRFFPRTESGIPPMPLEKARLYLEILKEERHRGYVCAVRS